MKFVLVEERQVDIDAFNRKFGEGSFAKFNKLKGRLKNNNVSVDIVYHTKNTSVEDMEKILSNAENRVVKDKETGKTKLNRKLIAENEYYAVYDILDWETSMNMGNDTGWCITGRYHTNGEVKPSQAKQYFNEYKEKGIENYLFFMPKKDVEKYCLCITRDPKHFQFWDSKDDGSAIGSVPINTTFPTFEFKGVSIGAYNGFTIRDGVLLSVDPTISGDVVIPDDVKGIGDEAFYEKRNITSVTLPNGLLSIGERAFCYCSKLISVNIPSSVISIGTDAFSACDALESITIHNGVTTIGDDAFYACDVLPSVTIPDSVTSIGEYAFCDCKKLTEVTLGSGVTSIRDYMFFGCSKLESFIVPKSVTSIGDRAFYDSGLTSLVIPDNVTSIGHHAFEQCIELASITIPKSVTEIGTDAFWECDKLTIFCEKGSYAEKYAQENNIRVEYIGEQQV